MKMPNVIDNNVEVCHFFFAVTAVLIRALLPLEFISAIFCSYL